MFGRHEITQNRVRDTISFKEGSEKLTLRVDADPMRLVVGLSQVQKMLKTITEETPAQEIADAAKFFATVIFGEEQASQLMAFYLNDGGCVINVCGKCFREFLLKKITKAQKKAKDE